MKREFRRIAAISLAAILAVFGTTPALAQQNREEITPPSISSRAGAEQEETPLATEGEKVGKDTDVPAPREVQAPEVRFEVTYLPRQGSEEVMYVENGDTVRLDLSKYIRMDIVPVIEHPDAGETKDKTFFWYKWSDPTGRRTEETEGGHWEDFTWGETINTLRVGELEHARPESAGEYYQLDIQGKIVSSSWGPSYGWDGSPVYESGDQEYYLYVEVVEGQENLAYIAASDYAWFIENQPEKYGLKEIYPTVEELIEKYLFAVFGEETYLESDNWEGEYLPIQWQLKPGTAYSAGKGAANTFVWSVSEEEFAQLGWTNTNQIPLNGELTLTNPGQPDPEPKPDRPSGGSPSDDREIDVTVRIEWQDNNNTEGQRPEEVEVQLYRDHRASGEPVVLNERGDWDYKWKDLSNSYLWTVAAAECPKGYSEAVTREDWHQYVITFTYGETEKNNPDTGR